MREASLKWKTSKESLSNERTLESLCPHHHKAKRVKDKIDDVYQGTQLLSDVSIQNIIR